MANKRKILEAARKLAQKGSKDKALKEYEKLLKLDPKDARLRIEIGDAYRRWGQVEDAISIYSKVAQQYMADGFDARAVAVFKQIHNLDPEHWASYEPLGELYQRMGLTAEAISTLQTAADGQHRRGNKREALELLRKMATIDPSNTTSRLKVADLLRQEGMNQEAITEYQEVVAELGRQGEQEGAGQALERILEIDPDHDTALVQMVENLVARGLFDHAEPFARRCIERTPEDPEHYERLAQVYSAQHRDQELKDVYRRLAEVYRQRGDDDRARDIIQRFVPSEGLEVQPDTEMDLSSDEILDDGLDGDVSEFIADDDIGQETLLEDELIDAVDSAPEGAPRRSAQERATVPDLDVLEDIDELVADDPGSDLAPASGREVEATDEALPEGDPDQLLAEACVYLRYGKRAQAIANLRGVLHADPGHRGALEKLGEAHAEGGDSEQAVAQWLKAAERAREDGDHAAIGVLRDRIGALDPEAAAALAPAPGEDAPDLDLSDPDVDLSEISVDEGSGAGLDLDDIEIEVDDSELVDVDLDPHLDLDGPASEGAAVAAPQEAELELGTSARGASASSSQQIGEDLEEADFYIQQGLLDEAEAIYKRVIDVAPNHPQALVRLGEIAAARGEDPGSSTSGVGREASEPEELLDVPDVPVVEREPVEMPGEGPDEPPADLEDWTDGFSDGEGDALDLGGIDTEAIAAAEKEIDPNAETDLDLEEAAARAGASPAAADVPPAAPPPTAAPVSAIDSPVAPDDEALAPLAPAASELDAGFDLAAELSQAFDTDPQGASTSGALTGGDDGFAAVFQEFKKGVQNTLSDGDHQAHYDLGIAYREMGLLDDAMGEFRAAMDGEGRRLDCLQMLGLCSLERGDGDEAVAHFEQALTQSGINDAQQIALRFELGRAYEHLGDVARAREAWEAVAATQPGFCDVEERLDGLANLEKPEDPPEVQEDTAASDSFESFEDVIGDVESDDSSEAGHVDFDDLVAEANAEEQGDAGADDDEETEDAQSHEDFQDLLSEMGADPESDADAGIEADALAGVEDGASSAGAPGEAESEAPAEAQPAPETSAESTSPRPARKKKKISFV